MTVAPTAVHGVRAAGQTATSAWRHSDALLRTAIIVLGAIVVLTVIAVLTGVTGSTSATIGGRLEGASALAPLGTDNLGRSLLPRLFEGIATTLVVSIVAVVCSAAVSTLLGMLSGYYGGGVNEVVMRVADVLYAFPALVLAILVSAPLGPGRPAAIISIVVITIPLMTRVVRLATRSVAERDFIVSARISGVRTPVIFVRRLLPNIAGTIAVQASYALSVAILVEGGLSFLGFGVQVPEASLGLLIQQGMLYMTQAPQLLIVPGAVLVVSILCINIIGDGLRDRFEPRETRSLK
ncbi:ABC transporter permease [Microbacterium murale]|uniref:Peptide/nickel transport system permease protein n=1 Tax=Microbacterium murale TaxID=1081040 RepID=A0ABU0PBI8_9MICO|nr:ABC transporter permease [Microbacterium murale]MDQ0644699.1 peptide/nickel transport system permease protein [Microbacterium murale]